MLDRLTIRTFGGLSIQVEGRDIRELASRKAEVLLVYLALQRRPCSREVLAELLWEERSQSQAGANLRVVLASLNKHLGNYLDIERLTISYGQNALVWVDAVALEDFLGSLPDQAEARSGELFEQVKKAVDLYRGEFLEGLYFPDARDLSEWIAQERRHLLELVLHGFGYLAEASLKSGEFAHGADYASRLVKLDPFRESGQRLLMRLQALSGKRSAALSQYERFKLLLAQELGIEPEAETTGLFHQLQRGDLQATTFLQKSKPDPEIQLPPSLQAERQAPPVFVGRDEQLQNLDSALKEALTGRGQMRFIIGGPGRGKTLLMEELARRASAAHPDLLVAYGGCSAFSGTGDSYLPFRDILGMLTGDLETKLSAGMINAEQARSLWQALPLTLQTLQDHGPDLLGVFVQGKEIYLRTVITMNGQPGNLMRLAWLKESRPPAPGELETAALFDEYLHVLMAISSQQPLLLLLDDLQWADKASINLLFHLGRRIASGRILLVGAYRAEELAQAERGQREILSRALAELKRQHGDIWIDLEAISESQGRQFIDQYLDTEPNRLEETFRQALYHHTGGHPLFTVELYRSLRERGNLARGADGAWQAEADLDWKTLPARVEGVIEARLGRLDDDQYAALEAAAVEGEEFTAQIVAQVCGKEERWMARQMTSKLSHVHLLVSESGVVRVGGRPLFRFRFRHSLYREYLYQRLGEGNRSRLHGEIGAALESLYGDQANEIAPLLGWHYSEAGDVQKAILYHLLAGDQAHLRFAYPEAILHYQRAASWLKESGNFGEAARTLMKVGLAYHTNLEFDRSRQAYDEGFILWQRANLELPTAPIAPTPHSLHRAFTILLGLDRVRYNTQTVSLITQQIFSGLVVQDAELGVVPDGATSWEILDGGLKYIFHLREDVKWSDGTPVTANDYVCAWKRVLDPELKSDCAYNLYNLKGASNYNQGQGSPEDLGVYATGHFTLVAELEKPASYFLHLLADSSMFPVPENILIENGDNWTQPGVIQTNGPFIVLEWVPGSRLVLSRNPYYHGQFSGNLVRVEITIIKDRDMTTCVRGYEAGLFDVVDISDLDPAITLDKKLGHPGEYIEKPEGGTYLLSFYTGIFPFDDRKVRQAFAYSIDREALVNQVSPISLPATGGLVPPGMPGHSPGIGLGYHPDLAQKLLAEAGYPGGKDFPEVTILETDIPGLRSLAEILSGQWRQTLGVNIREKYVPFKYFLTPLDGSFNIGPHWIVADYPDIDWYLRSYIESYALKFAWQNDAYDQIIQRASQELDQKKRLVYYMQADKFLMEEAVTVPVMYGVNSYLIKPWVKRFPISAGGKEFWKDVVIEPH